MEGPDSDPDIVGFIDVGTNSIHLLVVKFVPGTSGIEIAQEREVVRLGRSLYGEGVIDEEAIEKSRLVIKSFVEYAKKQGAKQVFAFATCAAREATNCGDLVNALRSDGLDLRVIPGEEEARLIKLGVLGINAPPENTLLIDIGGGSTEVSISKGREILFLDSMPLGAVRYAYGYPYDPMGPLTYDEYSSYQHNIDINSYHTVKEIKDIGFKNAIGSSGTFEALADICSAERGDGDPSHVSLSEIRSLMSRLRSMNGKERCRIQKLNPNRVDIIVAGGAIAEELMTLLGIEDIKVSHYGLKEGMKIDYLLNHGVVNIDVRESSVRALAYRCQYDREHADRVKYNAMVIFDGLRDMGVHSMPDEMRELLGYACVLHDIGEFFSYQKHQINSFNIILNSSMLGFSYREIATIALITRFHHKKFPSSRDQLFSELGITDPSDIRKCIVMLRMADAIDRHRLGTVDGISLHMDGSNIVLVLSSERNIDMEIWKLEEIEKDFSDVFSRGLAIERAECPNHGADITGQGDGHGGK